MNLIPCGHSPISFQSSEDNPGPGKTSLDENRKRPDSEAPALASRMLGKTMQLRLRQQCQAEGPSRQEHLPFRPNSGYRGGHISSVSSSSSSVKVNVVSDVPYLKQSGDYGCWEASMNMLRAYFNAPPIGKEKLAYLYNADGSPKPLDGQIDYKTRNRYANLVNIPPPDNRRWSVDSINAMLDKYGPVEALLELDEQYEHNVVLVGIDADKKNVLYHDPAVGQFESMSLERFNDTFCWARYKSALTVYDK